MDLPIIIGDFPVRFLYVYQRVFQLSVGIPATPRTGSSASGRAQDESARATAGGALFCHQRWTAAGDAPA